MMSSSSSSSVAANALRIGRSSANRVIFGHGLGDSPRGWADVCSHWSRELPNVQFVLPAAPMRQVTLNMGAEMPAWYDLPTFQELSKYASRLDVDATGIEQAVQMFSEHVIDPERTVFAGFSQGAAVALYTGLCAAVVSKSKVCMFIVFLFRVQHASATNTKNKNNAFNIMLFILFFQTYHEDDAGMDIPILTTYFTSGHTPDIN